MLKLLIPIILWCGMANAASPIVTSYRDFSGGLNTYYAPTTLAANESPNLMNVSIDDPMGALTQRKGYQTCGNTPSGNTATNLYEYSKNDGSRSLIVTDNISIWSTVDCVVFSTIATGLNSQSMPRFATILDKMWIVNGSTWAITWDGTTATYLDGTGTKPNVPKGKYITYWKSRVWIASNATSPSSLFFSILVDGGGNFLAPDTSTGAWSSTNQIYINRDDGSPIYGIKQYRDNMYIWKETGISRLVFEDEYNLSVTKNVSAVGSKFQDSIVEMDDGLIRFVGRDGVYAFDGSMVKRISTKWTPTFENIKQPSHAEQYKLWDTAADWLTGSLVGLSTFQTNGSLEIILSSSTVLLDGFSAGLSKWSFTEGTNYFTNTSNALHYGGVGTAVGTGVYANTAPNSFPYGLHKFYMRSSSEIRSDGATDYLGISFSLADGPLYSTANRVTVKLMGGYSKSTLTLENKSGVLATVDCTARTRFVSPRYYWDTAGTFTFNRANGMITVALSTPTLGSCPTISIPDTNAGKYYGYVLVQGIRYAEVQGLDQSGETSDFDEVYISSGGYGTTTGHAGLFTSPISTATNIAVWKTFDADHDLNGQTITYQMRTGNTVAATAGATWQDISSGNIVSVSTNGFAQWKAAFENTTHTDTPVLNSASIGWITGDTTLSPITALNYKSRYWMSASTIPGNNYNDVVFVESKSPLGTHTRYDLPLSAMVLWSNNLYGAIGNTSKIVRLDYGATDDGSSINSYWESRDEVYDNPIYLKTVNVGVLDYSNVPANTGLNIGLSPDQGVTYQTRSVNVGTSILPRNTKKLNWDANTSLGFRTKVSNNTLGIGFKIYGLYNSGTMLDFFGN